MNDTLLFYTGAFVFGLMFIGVVFTIVEFRQLGKKDKRRRLKSQNPLDSD